MKRFYLFGSNISNSFSPKLHAVCFQQLGLPHTYDLFERPLDDCEKLMEEEEFGGASVTIPFKRSFAHKVEYANEAAQLDNINTIVKQEGTLTGYNTDHLGVQNSLPLKEIKRAIIIGAGATASTILWVLARHGIPSVVASRSSASE